MTIYVCIITIEDNAELQIQGVANLVRLEAKSANAQGGQDITIRDLIKAALRMRPDRLSGISGVIHPIFPINQGFLHQVYPRSVKAFIFRRYMKKEPQQIHICTCCGGNRGKFNILNLSCCE